MKRLYQWFISLFNSYKGLHELFGHCPCGECHTCDTKITLADAIYMGSSMPMPNCRCETIERQV